MYVRFLSIAILLVVTRPFSAFAQSPVYPDGYVIWTSDRQDSRSEVYRARADGSEVTRLTQSGANLPAWAPDGRWISYMDPSNAINVMRPDGSETRMLAVGWQIMWLHDNAGLLVGEGNDFNVYDPETGESRFVFARSDYPQFDGTTFQVNAMTHDNRYVLLGSHLFINGYTASNGSITSEYSAVVLDLLHKDKVYYLGSGCWPFTPPLGDLVFHICADCPKHPDIYRMSLADLDTRASYAPEVAHDDGDWGHEYNPRVSNDNRWLAYMASAGCHQGEGCDYDIWLHQLGADPSQRLRVTQHPSFDGYPQLFVGPLWQPSLQPRSLVTPNRVTFHASATALPPAQLVTVKNSGGGTLPAATLAMDPVVPWLDVSQSGFGITVGLRSGADITRGTHCTNLTITTEGALGSPVTVPVTLIADETFPYAEAGVWADAAMSVDTGVLAEAGMSSEAGVSRDVAADADPAPFDGSTLDCNALETGGQPSVDAGQSDGGSGPTVRGSSGGGCGCRLGGLAPSAAPAGVVLAGLALLLRRSRRRSNR